MNEPGNTRRECRHGCGFVTRSFALGRHERQCVTTYSRLLIVLQNKQFINVGDQSKCWTPDESVWPIGYRVKISGGRRAHVVAFEVVHGPLPPGKEVCHTCDVGNCANPDHVWAGTHKENMKDMHHKQRANGWGARPERSTALRRARGWQMSDSQRQRLSETHRGKQHTEETKRKISLAHRGRSLSDKHKQAISEGRQRHNETICAGKVGW